MLLKKWLNQNILSLNVSKTKFMPISLRKNADYQLEDLVIHVCGNVFNNSCSCKKIDKVTSYKYLGIVFDSNMKWSEHVDFLKKKIRKYIFAFRQLSQILVESELKIAYYAYVQSLLSFGIIAFGGAYKTILQPLFVIQKSILKVAFKKYQRYPTDNLFSEIGVLTVRQLFVKVILVHIYKYSDVLFERTAHSHNTRFSTNVGIVVPQSNKTFSRTNSYYVSQIIYRNMCQKYKNISLLNLQSISSFKKRVVEWLVSLGSEETEAVIALGST